MSEVYLLLPTYCAENVPAPHAKLPLSLPSYSVVAVAVDQQDHTAVDVAVSNRDAHSAESAATAPAAVASPSHTCVHSH